MIITRMKQRTSHEINSFVRNPYVHQKTEFTNQIDSIQPLSYGMYYNALITKEQY